MSKKPSSKKQKVEFDRLCASCLTASNSEQCKRCICDSDPSDEDDDCESVTQACIVCGVSVFLFLNRYENAKYWARKRFLFLLTRRLAFLNSGEYDEFLFWINGFPSNDDECEYESTFWETLFVPKKTARTNHASDLIKFWTNDVETLINEVLLSSDNDSKGMWASMTELCHDCFMKKMTELWAKSEIDFKDVIRNKSELKIPNTFTDVLKSWEINSKNLKSVFDLNLPKTYKRQKLATPASGDGLLQKLIDIEKARGSSTF